MVIKKDDYGMIELSSVNSKKSVDTFSSYLQQFFNSLKNMSEEDQRLLSKYYVEVFGVIRKKSDDVYNLLTKNAFLNKMLENTDFNESSLLYFSFETGEFSVYDDLEEIKPIRKSVYITNMHGLFSEFLKTGAYVYNKIKESTSYLEILDELMDLELECDYYDGLDHYSLEKNELNSRMEEVVELQIKFVNEIYKKLTKKTVEKYCDFAAEYFLTNFVRKDLETFVSWVHDDLDVNSIDSISAIISKYYSKSKLYSDYQHLSYNNERYEIENHNIQLGAEAFFNIEILGLPKVIEVLDSTLEKITLSTLNKSSSGSGSSTLAEKVARSTFESLDFLYPYYPLSEVFNRSKEKLKLTLSTNYYRFYSLPKKIQKEIVESSRKVILELPDKMSEDLLANNNLNDLSDNISSLTNFYIYMSGSGNKASGDLVDCTVNGLEWSEKFSDMLGLFLKTILNSRGDQYYDSLNILSSLASKFAYEAGRLPKRDFNKLALVDDDGDYVLLLRSSKDNFELNVESICDKKLLPIDSFALTEIDSVTIKGLKQVKMEFAVNLFETLFNMLLKNNNILIDEYDLEILSIFQKSFEYNLIGLSERQNQKTSQFIEKIIENNKK